MLVRKLSAVARSANPDEGLNRAREDAAGWMTPPLRCEQAW